MNVFFYFYFFTGRKSLEYQVQDESRKYEHKYKGISLVFNILARCLGGRYINFGVFWLYQDKAIDDAFDMALRLMMAIPMQDLTVRYINRKLGRWGGWKMHELVLFMCICVSSFDI